MTWFPVAGCGLVLSAAVSACLLSPAAAAPAGVAALGAAVDRGAEPVRARRTRGRVVRPGVRAGMAAGALAAGAAAAVGGYGHNAYHGAGPYSGHNYPASNGRTYPYCVLDDGYGRVRPCDAGGGGVGP